MDFFVWNTISSTPMIRPCNQTAKNFVDMEFNLEGWQWLGDSFCVDPGLLENVISSLEDEGFNVQIEQI